MLRRIDASGFRRVVLGGSAMPPDLPANAVTTYGMTETGSGVVYDGVPLDGVEVRIVDGDTVDGDTVDGEIVDGEIWLRCPMALRCYRDGTDPKDTEGWLPTGDAGRWDEASGTLQVFGRTADVVITGGENVWPVAVERVLAVQPGVREVAVVGRPDPEWGERVVALVVPADAADPPTLETLRLAVKAVLPGYAAPRELELVDALPRTGSGKVARTLLRPPT
jgi:O-succinylbenzoic acid--CoA ligase